jgi:hypothetical protein
VGYFDDMHSGCCELLLMTYVTKKDLSWFERHREAARELKDLRKEHEKLAQTFAALVYDNARMKRQLIAVKEALE